MKSYETWIDEKGNEVFCGDGLGGDCFMTFRTPPGKNKRKRVKSPDLPVRKTLGSALRDLIPYAAKRGWKRKDV